MGSITLSELKARINEPGTESDAALTQVLEGARRHFERMTGRALDSPPVPVSRELHASGGAALLLPDRMTSISAVYVRDSVEQDWLPLDPSGWSYPVSGSARVLYRVGSHWPDGAYLVRVDGMAGYPPGQIPDDWCEAVYSIAAQLWTDARRVGSAVPPELGETGSRLPAIVWDAVRQARGIPVGL